MNPRQPRSEPALRPAWPIALGLLLAACSGGSTASTTAPLHEPGAESFSSPAGGGPRTSGTGAGAGGPATPGATDGTSGAPATRTVEEADVWQKAGSTLFIANAWRGLVTVGVADPAAPALLARLPLDGTPVDLYVRGGVAFVITRGAMRWALDAPAAGAAILPMPWTGSRIVAVDVADPAHPVTITSLEVEGQIETTRLVGDVLYVVSRRIPWFDFGPVRGGVAVGPGGTVTSGSGVAATGPALATVDATSDLTYVASFDLSAPAAPRAVARLDFPSAGWSTTAHVGQDRITLAQSGWGADGKPHTSLRAVDISDPAGALLLGGDATVDGLVRDRWGIDFDAATGLVRAAADPGWNAGAVLTTVAWADPRAPAWRGALRIDVAESLTAARFDGDRAYLVTALRTDPLWVIDTSDPAKPILAGHLQMPGQLDFIEPRGDRLVALGHTNEAGAPFQLQVSLLDVTDPGAPALLGRVLFGPDWGWVPASADDLRKAFQVLDAEGLILVPFQGFDRTSWSWQGGTQLLTFSRDALVAGGFLAHQGALRRAMSLSPGRLAALSDERLQSIDSSDRAHPVELASLDLARSVNAIAVLGATAVELCGDGWRGTTEIVVNPASDPEAVTPLARLAAPGMTARLFERGSVAWVLSGDPWSGEAAVEAIDVADPSRPLRRGKLALGLPSSALGGWWWMPAALAVDELLVVQRTGWSCAATCTSTNELLVVDLSDADAPALAATVELPGAGWTSGLLAAGRGVIYTQYDWQDQQSVRYLAGRVDLTDARSPRRLPRVNVPGTVFAASDDGTRLWTEEQAWEAAPSGTQAATTWIHALRLTDHGTARLEESAALDGWFAGARVSAGAAWLAGSDWRSGHARLAGVRLEPLAVRSTVEVPAWWAGLLDVKGDTAFVVGSTGETAVLVYDVADAAHPVLRRAVRTSGWVSGVEVEGATAWLPAGPYGVLTVPLTP
jgi:hypothetical protein